MNFFREKAKASRSSNFKLYNFKTPQSYGRFAIKVLKRFLQ